MASSVAATCGTFTSVQRQYPHIDLRDPAGSFFNLFRSGKLKDTDTEYGALSVARDYPSVSQALAGEPERPTFIGQTVGDKCIEMLFDDRKEPQFEMARNFALLLREHNIDTQYSHIAETVATLHLEPREADAQILTMLDEPGIRKFVQVLVTLYHGRGVLSDVFDALDSKITEMQGGEDDTLSTDAVSSWDGTRAPATTPANDGEEGAEESLVN